jgi:hypothetical protein
MRTQSERRGEFPGERIRIAVLYADAKNASSGITLLGRITILIAPFRFAKPATRKLRKTCAELMWKCEVQRPLWNVYGEL